MVWLGAALSAQADTVYLKQGDVYAGTVTYIDADIIMMELSNGEIKEFPASGVFRVIGDNGDLLFDGSGDSKVSETLQPWQISVRLSTRKLSSSRCGLSWGELQFWDTSASLN
jgi:hypothetical protein